VGRLFCHRANAKDRNGRNMDMDIGILRDRPTAGNYGALTKRVAEGTKDDGLRPCPEVAPREIQLEIAPETQKCLAWVMQSPPGRVRSVLHRWLESSRRCLCGKIERWQVEGHGHRNQPVHRKALVPTTVDYVPHRITNHMRLCITTGCEQERKDEPIHSPYAHGTWCYRPRPADQRSQSCKA